MQAVIEWLWINPARWLVLISAVLSGMVLMAEYNGRRSGGSGWLTLARVASGVVFTLVTAIVAAVYGGVGAFFGYLLLQIVVSIALPMMLVDRM